MIARRTRVAVVALVAGGCNSIAGIHEPIAADPMAVAPRNLQLWLTADAGIQCAGAGASQRITSWADQSPAKHDATLASGQMGPLCGAGAVTTLAGVPLPLFAGEGDNAADDTLDVTLDFLRDSSYSLFVVDRRAAAPTKGELYTLGTLVFDGNLRDGALQFGYRTDDVLTVAQYADDLDASVTPQPAARAFSIDEAVFDATKGHFLYVDGALIKSNAATTPLQAAMGGYVGRGGVTTVDERFIGEIAEVLVYDVALTDGQRQVVEAYLRYHWGFAFPN